MRLRDVMTRDVEVVGPEESLAAAAERMRQFDTGALPVCHGRKLVGIITDRDLVVRGLALHLDAESTPVERCMSEDVVWCTEDEELRDAMRKMAENQVRRLLVLDGERNVVGILSLGDASREGPQREAAAALGAISEPAPALH